MHIFFNFYRTMIRAASTTVLRTRNQAAANESIDIGTIIDAINLRTPAGCRIVSAFKDKFGLDITAARARKGTSRGTHYDFEIQVNSEWKKVEHKGERVYRLPSPEEVPWKAGVQFYNGGCEKFSITRKYAHTWYTLYIESGSLRNEFGITAPTPTSEEWFQLDCRAQGQPRSAFGKELKIKVRQIRGPDSSLLEKRAAVLDALEITDEDKRILIGEVLAIVKNVLSQKEVWLSIHGHLESDFHAVWYPQFTIDDIKEVIVGKEKDVKLTFLCSNDFRFNAIIRWGMGAGLSCLRVDLK